MVSRINTVAFEGINTRNINVQVHIGTGLPAFNIVGLADKAVGESKERIRAALSSVGLSLPASRITVNLSPADVQKEGSHFDLPIAIALMHAMGAIPDDSCHRLFVLGELALDGTISPVAGIFPAAIHALSEHMGIVCPHHNGSEACLASDMLDIIAPAHINDLVNHFHNRQLLSRPQKLSPQNLAESYLDIQDIKGQTHAKRALEIAAAGGHNMLMVGPPGSGKSMLASRLNSILPPVSAQEILDISMIASVTGNFNLSEAIERPFRAPHHSCSMAAMIGGGKKANPGEVTLAHRGVLFLDELPEFPRQVLESLRQPIESGDVTVSRAAAHITYPANFQLIGAMNPCRCGYFGDESRSCYKAPKCAADYQAKLSGPFLDRIDVHVELPAISPLDIKKGTQGESSTVIRNRVQTARQIQKQRYEHYKNTLTNADATSTILSELNRVDDKAQLTLDTAYEKLSLSMRGYHRSMKVARTIADLDGSDCVKHHHIAEALGYRNMQNTHTNSTNTIKSTA